MIKFTNKIISILSVVAIMGAPPVFHVHALDNGLAKTPPMGWNSWNIFQGDINETKIKQIADVMVSSGMKDAGYVYLNLDDNWMASSRDAQGNLKADPTRFPNGIKSLADYVHAKGLKLGVYGDHGSKTCMGVANSGSYGKEAQDAKTFASWEVDYLKYDNCNIVSGSNQRTDYENMRDGLAKCGQPIVFSICMWKFQSWMPETGNLWRIADDITDKWDNGTGYFHGIVNCIDLNADNAGYAKPGAWNDPDMLEIGNGGCTAEEYRTQMTMWCVMASPLIAGNDIRSMKQEIKDILLNKEAIAVDQDSAGIQGTRVKSGSGCEIWCKPLGSKNGTTKAVALLNRNAAVSDITVTFSDIGLSGTVKVRDLWAKAEKGAFTGSYTMSVPSHGTGMLRISASPITRIDRASAESRGSCGFTTKFSEGKIIVSPRGGLRQFDVSVYMPDGRLVACKGSAAGVATIPAGTSGVHILTIRCGGYREKKTVSLYN
jgi:alpha-galactosidase